MEASAKIVFFFQGATHHIPEDEQHHSSCNLDDEDNQHNDEELWGEEMINNHFHCEIFDWELHCIAVKSSITNRVRNRFETYADVKRHSTLLGSNHRLYIKDQS